MDTTSISSTSSSNQRNVSAFFEASGKAESSAKALAEAGFTADEIIQTEQNGGYLVTIADSARAGDAVGILKEHGGSIAGDFSGLTGAMEPSEDTGDEPGDSAAQSAPIDSGLTGPVGDRPASGGTYTSGSLAGGSGSGTASGGSLFGSSR